MDLIDNQELTNIYKLLIKTNEEEGKKLKKYKVVDRNIKMYNRNANLKIKRKTRNKKFYKAKEELKMIHTIKMVPL